MSRHPHHYRIAIALAISAGAWGIYWLPQRILEEGGLTGGWGTIAQMIIGVLILIPNDLHVDTHFLAIYADFPIPNKYNDLSNINGNNISKI